MTATDTHTAEAYRDLVDARPTCSATIGRRPGAFGFASVGCGQSVGVRGYWAQTERWENTGHFVAYCAIPGHETNVRRRFPEVAQLMYPVSAW